MLGIGLGLGHGWTRRGAMGAECFSSSKQLFCNVSLRLSLCLLAHGVCDLPSCTCQQPRKPVSPLRTETRFCRAGSNYSPDGGWCFVQCLGGGPCCRDALQAGEMAGEEAFANQLVEIMVFTSSQLSLGRYFYSFTWWFFFFFIF